MLSPVLRSSLVRVVSPLASECKQHEEGDELHHGIVYATAKPDIVFMSKTHVQHGSAMLDFANQLSARRGKDVVEVNVSVP